MQRITVVHLINALESGGAEKVLFDTIQELDDGFEHVVLALSLKGMYKEKIESLGACLEKLSVRSLFKLFFWPRESTVIHSYMYRAHFFSALFSSMRFKVIWSVHGSFPEKPGLACRMAALLSHFVPASVVYVSEYCCAQHVNIGYKKHTASVIYNGLSNRALNNRDVGKDWVNSIGSRSVKICMVCRYHPIKNYARFLDIAKEVVNLQSSARFYLIGKDNIPENLELVNMINRRGLTHNIVFCGEVSNMCDRYTEFDLLVSTSNSESFGLTILEALSAGVNVSSISLDVVDELLGEYSTNDGHLKTDRDIAVRWLQKAADRPSIGVMSLINSKFSKKGMAGAYKRLYCQTLGRSG